MKWCLLVKTIAIFLTLFTCVCAQAEQHDQFTVLDSVFTVQYRSEFSDSEKQKVISWLQQAAQAVTTLYGRFPESRVRVQLEKNNAREPVSWGHVNRAKIPTIVFFINTAYSLKAFQRDWVAVHEFSHLLLPYAGNNDTWFSEGLATYYQNVLRARHGMISERLAWQRLIEGFQRGESDRRYGHLTLAKLSPIMRDTRSYMRVYWAGTAYFLNADIEIRRLTNGKLSIDYVLDEFNRCCKNAYRVWNGRKLAQQLDNIAKLNVFLPFYEQYKNSLQMPDTQKSLRLLGVSMGRQGLVLDDKALLATIREAIM